MIFCDSDSPMTECYAYALCNLGKSRVVYCCNGEKERLAHRRCCFAVEPLVDPPATICASQFQATLFPSSFSSVLADHLISYENCYSMDWQLIMEEVVVSLATDSNYSFLLYAYAN